MNIICYIVIRQSNRNGYVVISCRCLLYYFSVSSERIVKTLVLCCFFSSLSVCCEYFMLFLENYLSLNISPQINYKIF